VEFLDALPKNPSSKLQRYLLQERATEQTPVGPAVP
jgi:acyl-coenzyme A synthetase/AMP-(fatty) acid ligase